MSKKSGLKERILLARLKYKTLDLYSNGQLPFALVKYIDNLTLDDDVDYVKMLMSCVDTCLRVRGYYHNHRQEEKEINLIIENKVKDYFVSKNG